MSRPAEWSKRAQQKRDFPEPEWLDSLEDEDEQGPEVLPHELSTPWSEPQVDPYHGDHYHTMPGFGPRRMK